jgi:hypothetical protein
VPEAGLVVSPSPVDVGETVTLDASNSTDPDGDTLSYSWDLDNDGSFDDATGPVIETSYRSAGDKTISVKVFDGEVADIADRAVTVYEQSIALGLEPDIRQISAGEKASYRVVAEDVDAGVGGYNVTVSTDDVGVANITDFTVVSGGNVDATFASDNSSLNVRVQASDTNQTGEVTLLRVEVTGVSEGQTPVDLSVTNVFDESQVVRPYTVTASQGATVAVVSGPPVLFDGALFERPTDPDNDGLFEDLDGNGRVSIRDSLLLFYNTDSEIIRENKQFFDYSGEGNLNLRDSLLLFYQRVDAGDTLREESASSSTIDRVVTDDTE